MASDQVLHFRRGALQPLNRALITPSASTPGSSWVRANVQTKCSQDTGRKVIPVGPCLADNIQQAFTKPLKAESLH